MGDERKIYLRSLYICEQYVKEKIRELLEGSRDPSGQGQQGKILQEQYNTAGRWKMI